MPLSSVLGRSRCNNLGGRDEPVHKYLSSYEFEEDDSLAMDDNTRYEIACATRYTSPDPKLIGLALPNQEEGYMTHDMYRG